MQRKITRFALTGKCGCGRAPRQSSGFVRPARRRGPALPAEHRQGDAAQAVAL